MTQVPKRYGRRIKGLTQAAAILGCTRQHLRLVILGRRKSPELLNRYHAIKDAMETQTLPHKMTPQEFDARAAALLVNMGRSVESIAAMVDVFTKKRVKIQKDFTEMQALLKEAKTALTEIKNEALEDSHILRAEAEKCDDDRLAGRQRENGRRESRSFY